MASTPPKEDNPTPPANDGNPTPPPMVNPYAKTSATKTGASPKSPSKKKKQSKKKKTPAEPGEPLKLEDLPDIPQKADGSFNFATLGRAASTQETRKQAIKLYNTYATLYNKPQFEDLVKADVEGELMEKLMYDIGGFLSIVPIPKNYKEGFAPPNVNSKAMIMISTLITLLIALKCCLREKFPDHPTWPRSPSDNLEWCKTLFSQVTKDWKRNYMNIWSTDPDLTFGNIKIQPLYSKQYPHVTKEDLAEQAAWYAEELSDNTGRAFETP